jgi:hypothetical protein
MRNKAVALMRTILDFDYAETASKICSISDAQKLGDFISYVSRSINWHCMLICSQLVSNKQSFQWWNSQLASTASLLLVEIYARIPVVPRSVFLNNTNLRLLKGGKASYQGKVATLLYHYGMNASKCVTLVNVTLIISHKGDVSKHNSGETFVTQEHTSILGHL